MTALAEIAMLKLPTVVLVVLMCLTKCESIDKLLSMVSGSMMKSLLRLILSADRIENRSIVWPEQMEETLFLSLGY